MKIMPIASNNWVATLQVISKMKKWNMFAARKEKGTMIFFETSWVVIIIIMVITIRDWRKRKDLEKPIDEKRLKELDEESEKVKKMVEETKAEWRKKGWIE